MNYYWAFVVGGAICVVGQLLIDLTSLTPARILTGYVVAGVVLYIAMKNRRRSGTDGAANEQLVRVLAHPEHRRPTRRGRHRLHHRLGGSREEIAAKIDKGLTRHGRSASLRATGDSVAIVPAIRAAVRHPDAAGVEGLLDLLDRLAAEVRDRRQLGLGLLNQVADRLDARALEAVVRAHAELELLDQDVVHRRAAGAAAGGERRAEGDAPGDERPRPRGDRAVAHAAVARRAAAVGPEAADAAGPESDPGIRGMKQRAKANRSRMGLDPLFFVFIL